jgi:hypothetical protein
LDGVRTDPAQRATGENWRGHLLGPARQGCLTKMIDLDELSADNLTIREEHPVYPSLPHSTDLANQFHRRVDRKSDLFR